ncbi:MAG: serine/threonine-protein kinase [Candidatus Xenobia bacterium]
MQAEKPRTEPTHRGIVPRTPPSTEGFQVGRVLADRYCIERKLGQGGMGAVYLATQLLLHTSVAIKEVRALPHHSIEEQQRQILNEACFLSRLSHAGLPRVYDCFVLGESCYLVMDYVTGCTLADYVEAMLPGEAQVVGWAQQLLDVLGYLHQSTPAVVFRDLKPSNIMLGADMRLKLIDFGIARFSDPCTGRGTRMVVRGAGMPGYCALEQCEGLASDPRSDIYALGATLYTLLTRVVPPSAVDLACGRKRLMPLSTLRPDVSVRTARAIHHMLAIKPADRPASIDAVRRELLEATPSGRRSVPALLCCLLAMLPLIGPAAALRPAHTVRPASLYICSEPEGAAITFNGHPFGVTPIQLTHSPCNVRVKLVHRGFEPVSETLSLAPGDDRIFHAPLRPR